MKKLILYFLLLFVSIPVSAEVVRDGNTFYTQKQTSNSYDVLTPYTWKDKEGRIYPIYISKNGACYVIKISKKTGKQYKYYLPKAVQEQIKMELGI